MLMHLQATVSAEQNPHGYNGLQGTNPPAISGRSDQHFGEHRIGCHPGKGRLCHDQKATVGDGHLKPWGDTTARS